MDTKDTPLAKRGQADIVDYLEVMLRNGKAPPLDELLELMPDEPLAPPHDVKDTGWLECEDAYREDWLREARELHAKYPGYQDSYWKREEMRWSNYPTDGSPLIEFVRALIGYLKADWCDYILNKDTCLQFRQWLPGHLDPNSFWLQRKTAGWPEALQILRIACGLPRFAPTRGQKA
jgi:hypothetical protein